MISTFAGQSVHLIWDKVKPLVDKVYETQKKHGVIGKDILDTDDTLAHIVNGHGLLVVIHDNERIMATMMVEILNTDAGRSLNLSTLGGEGIYDWRFELLDFLINFAKQYKCNDMRIYMVRPAWARCLKPFGFRDIGMKKYSNRCYRTIAREV